MKNYMNYYAEYYGIKWNHKDFEIHHLDRNRDNNDIKNLVLIPKSVHRKYHWALSIIEKNFIAENYKEIKDSDFLHCKDYALYFEAKSEIIEFYQIKDILLALKKDKINKFEDILETIFYQLWEKYVPKETPVIIAESDNNADEFIPKQKGRKTKKFLLTLTPDLFERIKTKARTFNISINGYITQMLETFI